MHLTKRIFQRLTFPTAEFEMPVEIYPFKVPARSSAGLLSQENFSFLQATAMQAGRQTFNTFLFVLAWSSSIKEALNLTALSCARPSSTASKALLPQVMLKSLPSCSECLGEMSIALRTALPHAIAAGSWRSSGGFPTLSCSQTFCPF